MAECNDAKCPFHGKTKVRGITLEGVVVSDKMTNSVVVERKYLRKDQKYERYQRRKSRVTAHNPPCIQAKSGDRVEIGETKRLSKTKSFVVLKKLGEAQ